MIPSATPLSPIVGLFAQGSGREAAGTAPEGNGACARMRRGTGWGDVTIHNMSSRGLLATADEEFRPGTVIEIRRIHHIIVGRVVWAKGQYFGVRTQDKIDIDGIVSAKPPAQEAGDEAGASGPDRRGANRAVSSPSGRPRAAASPRASSSSSC